MLTSSIEKSSILVSSCSLDRETWEPVVHNLAARGYDVAVFEADKVALQDASLELSISNTDGMQLRYDQLRFCLDGIRAAWFRRPSTITNPAKDGALQMSLDGERRLLQSGIWDAIHDESWLNSPNRIQQAERKVSQLRVAQGLGFTIPDTVITNDWGVIQSRLPLDIICKSNYSVLYDGDHYRQLYTTPFTNNSSGLPMSLNPYPGIWQTALSKAREWRITVVGDETFDAAIYTADDAKDDWRKHQLLEGAVDFVAEPFPDTHKEKCFAYLAAMGLRFGAFDFIEDKDGAITFLECNPNGQYMWIEQLLDLPISEAIADQLVQIAKSNT